MSTNPSEETRQIKPVESGFEERRLQAYEGFMRGFTYVITFIFLGWFIAGSQAENLSNGLYYTVLAFHSLFLSISCAFLMGRGAKGYYPYASMMFVWSFCCLQFILRVLVN